MLYEVTYYRGDKRLPDIDHEVSDSYLETLPTILLPNETAYARCLTDPSEDREIDKNGIRRVTR